MSEADDPTMPDTGGSQRSSVRLRSAELGDRYEVRDLLGRGGMGEVRLARDRRIDREVAVKMMLERATDDATLARFFREARVQGRLDHPAIVPIHDLGIDEHGNPYFVMKRLEGTTLAELIGTANPAQRERWSRTKLLGKFADICLAIQFAHERDVIHRDLKPSNLMLGEHGEAYVLDWGLARVTGDHGDASSPSANTPDATQAGDLLGTPGYMSPEQARGEPVDSRTDVFSLGCVLYEIVTGVPALPRGVPGITATREVEELRPSVKFPDVPLELDQLCARATAGDLTKRMTAGELGEQVQKYLDGDRDLEARKQLAATMAREARDKFDEARSGLGGDAINAARAQALRLAGRALALDPTNETALDITVSISRELPAELPAEALAAADRERGEARQQVLKWARGAIVALIAIELLLLFAPLRHGWAVAVLLASSIPVYLVVHVMARRPLPMNTPIYLVFMGFVALALFAACVVVGPLLILPMIAVGALGAFLAVPTSFSHWIVVTGLMAPIGVAVLLEAVGVLPSTFEFRDGELAMTTWVFDLTPTAAITLLAAAIVVQTFNSTVVAVSQRKAQDAAQNRVHAHQWQLAKLLPDRD